MDIKYQDALTETDTKVRHLLLGNGFSISCWNDFNYKCLLEKSKFKESPLVESVFNNLQTTNFEEIINAMQQTTTVVNTMAAYGLITGQISKQMRADADNIKKIFIDAINSTHPPKSVSINSDSYKTCRDFLKKFIPKKDYKGGKIFTLNYDLLLYWACMSDREEDQQGGKEKAPKAFKTLQVIDGFYNQTKWEKNNSQTLFFLHGALHLYRNGIELFKITYKENKMVMEQIKEYVETGEYPFLVLEGEHRYKLNSIDRNRYLLNSFEELSQINGVLFIIGSSFCKEDGHIWSAISRNNNLTCVYIGLHDSDKDTVKTKAEKFLSDKQCKFFDVKDAEIWNQNS